MKKKNKFYLLISIMLIISIFIGTLTYEINESLSSGTLIEPIVEEYSFLVNKSSEKINNNYSLEKQDKLIDKYLSEFTSEYTIDNPYVVVNPFGNANSALIMINTEDNVILTINCNGFIYKDEEATKKHIFIINDLPYGTNSIIINDDKQINVTIAENTESIEEEKCENCYIDLDKSGYIKHKLYLNEEYESIYIGNYIYLYKNKFINIYNLDGSIYKNIDISKYIYNNSVEIIGEVNNNIIIHLKEKEIYISYYLNDGTITDINEDYNNIKYNINITKNNIINISNKKYKVLTKDEILKYKDSNEKKYSIELIDGNLNILNNDNIKYVSLISTRGNAIKYEYDKFINLKALIKGNYYIYIEEDDGVIYNTLSYVEIN